ncbi:hypothetical protein Nepgr_021405 [Nepenthes gracilis]|uniref:Uncharacterized protein n=1 Tax=Nepenthes gracilis TaxID=150966 RepID=A0AAD3SZE7_NEPGR|nr:hypothetical protein Nepgr_021405 [Nepenthes gracilis]
MIGSSGRLTETGMAIVEVQTKKEWADLAYVPQSIISFPIIDSILTELLNFISPNFHFLGLVTLEYNSVQGGAWLSSVNA